MKNRDIAFSTTRYDKNNHLDRKSIQGRGVCRVAESEIERETGVRLHNKYFPEFSERINIERIKSTEHQSCVRVIEPTYIKFRNDELYGNNGTKEFSFSD